mgnify:FL=1
MRIPPEGLKNPLAYWLQRTALCQYHNRVARIRSLVALKRPEKTLPVRQALADAANHWVRYHNMAGDMLERGVSYID